MIYVLYLFRILPPKTVPQLPEAFCVMHKWGYIYKTVAFVWIKQNKIAKSWFYGMGYWTRSNAEICLLGIKGHPQRQSKCVHQLIVSPVEEHSKKPEIVRHFYILGLLFANQKNADIWRFSLSYKQLIRYCRWL